MVTVENLSKTFGTDTKVLKNINLNIKKNEIVAILGPSGTGKSTLLRCLNFLCIPTTGIIQIGNARVDAAGYTSKEVRNLRRQSAMVFQGYNLFKNKTALENVMEALVTVHNRPKAEAEETSLRLLEKVGMLDRKDFYPAKMSGGQQQRVAIARALAVSPDVLLFDEPTSALDPELVGEVLNTIRRLAEEDSTMVLVTHEIKFARNVATRILFMDNGMIAADGSPEELIDNPENPRLRQFLNFRKQIKSTIPASLSVGPITFYSNSGRKLMLTEQIKEKAEQCREEIIQFRRELHRHPELSMEEYETSHKIAEKLRSLEGMEVITGAAGGTGVVGILTGAKGAGKQFFCVQISTRCP